MPGLSDWLVAAFPFAMLRGSYSALKEEHVCWFCGLVRLVLRERRRTNPIAKQNPEKPRLLQWPGLLSSRLKPSDCSYTAASAARLIPSASLQPASDYEEAVVRGPPPVFALAFGAPLAPDA